MAEKGHDIRREAVACIAAQGADPAAQMIALGGTSTIAAFAGLLEALADVPGSTLRDRANAIRCACATLYVLGYRAGQEA